MSTRAPSVPEPLAEALRSYCNVNALDAIPRLRDFLRHDEHYAARVRGQLADAILKRTISPAEYEELTGHDFDSPDDLDRWLRQLWTDLFGDGPIG